MLIMAVENGRKPETQPVLKAVIRSLSTTLRRTVLVPFEKMCTCGPSVTVLPTVPSELDLV